MLGLKLNHVSKRGPCIAVSVAGELILLPQEHHGGDIYCNKLFQGILQWQIPITKYFRGISNGKL